MEPIISAFLSTLLTQIPVLLVWLAGIVTAVVRWPRHPRVSLLTLVALVVLFGLNLLNPLLRIWMIQSGLADARLGMFQGILNILFALVAAAAWILILLAIFSRRGSEG